MKLHSNKVHDAKSGDARPGDEGHMAEARSTRVSDGAQISSPQPPTSTQDVPMSPDSRDESTLRSRFHHTFDSSLDYCTHRSQPLLDPLLLQRSSYRSQSSQHPCGQTGHTFAQSSRTFPSTSPFQKSIVNGWYTCHSGVDSFPPKQCNNIPSLWVPAGDTCGRLSLLWGLFFSCHGRKLAIVSLLLYLLWMLCQLFCDTFWISLLKPYIAKSCDEISLSWWGLSGWVWTVAHSYTSPQWVIGTITMCICLIVCCVT